MTAIMPTGLAVAFCLAFSGTRPNVKAADLPAGYTCQGPSHQSCGVWRKVAAGLGAELRFFGNGHRIHSRKMQGVTRRPAAFPGAATA